MFVAAVESFKEAQDGLRTTFLSFVPEQKPTGVFGPVSDRILSSLREMDCILTASARWAKPGQVVAASEQLQAVISDADVQQILGLEYMATQFKVPLSLLESLGVLVFQMPELLRCLQHEEWLRNKPDNWFALLLAHLSTRDLKKDVDKLKALRIVPLEDGTLAAVAERKGRLFLPLPKETNYGFEDKIDPQGAMRLLPPAGPEPGSPAYRASHRPRANPDRPMRVHPHIDQPDGLARSLHPDRPRGRFPQRRRPTDRTQAARW